MSMFDALTLANCTVPTKGGEFVNSKTFPLKNQGYYDLQMHSISIWVPVVYTRKLKYFIQFLSFAKEVAEAISLNGFCFVLLCFLFRFVLLLVSFYHVHPAWLFPGLGEKKTWRNYFQMSTVMI